MRNHQERYDNNLVSDVEGKGDWNGKEKEEEICMDLSLHLHHDQGQKLYLNCLLEPS